MREPKQPPGSDKGVVFLEYGLLLTLIAAAVSLAVTPLGLRVGALFAAALGLFTP